MIGVLGLVRPSVCHGRHPTSAMCSPWTQTQSFSTCTIRNAPDCIWMIRHRFTYLFGGFGVPTRQRLVGRSGYKYFPVFTHRNTSHPILVSMHWLSYYRARFDFLRQTILFTDPDTIIDSLSQFVTHITPSSWLIGVLFGLPFCAFHKRKVLPIDPVTIVEPSLLIPWQVTRQLCASTSRPTGSSQSASHRWKVASWCPDTTSPTSALIATQLRIDLDLKELSSFCSTANQTPIWFMDPTIDLSFEREKSMCMMFEWKFGVHV